MFIVMPDLIRHSQDAIYTMPRIDDKVGYAMPRIDDKVGFAVPRIDD